jgi:hypothetical protein
MVLYVFNSRLICCIPTECDKSFTRSDALSKHMRQQHGIEPAIPGRGGRKRKRDPTEAEPPSKASSPTLVKAEAIDEDVPPSALAHNGEHSRDSSPNAPNPDLAANDSSDDELPPSLAKHYDHNTGLVMGKSPALAKYLVMKAKYQYILAEHDLMLDELDLARKEETRLRASKDAALDHVLLAELGYVSVCYHSHGFGIAQ